MADRMKKIDKDKFSFEDLEIWQEAVVFADQCLDITEKIETDRKHYRVIEQLESAATSTALNIAEGKGRFSKKEFVQFLYIARGSLFETITLLEIFHRRNWIKNPGFVDLKRSAARRGKRISSLINSIKNPMSYEL
jgi:four helix bundle protein